MVKKYIVRLSDAERQQLLELVRNQSASSQKVRRANILLMADANGSNWIDTRIAEAFHCRVQTVEKLRERFVTLGYEVALNGRKREQPPRAKLLDGKQEAKIIATRLGKPPAGFAHWTLRLLAERVVELKIVPTISHETVRQTLKKTR
jgi:hypothetical protein